MTLPWLGGLGKPEGKMEGVKRTLLWPVVAAVQALPWGEGERPESGIA